MTSQGDAAALVREGADTYVGWLTEACSIPSMAGDDVALARMSDWVEDKLVSLGATIQRLSVPDAPDAILGTIGAGERTLLVYDHYDVQPVDPLELWNSKPFEPEIRDGVFFARGSADNKGDLVARLAGLDVYEKLHGDLPYTLKFLVEGEEEAGSAHFHDIVHKYADRLSADGCVWEGHGIDHAGRPELVFGAKGLAYVELVHTGLNDDQHSSLAVYAPSPVWHMVEAIATLRAPDGRVLIDGFYDDVVEADEQDLEMLRRYPFDEEEEMRRLGVDHFVGNATGLEFLRRYFFDPTCNIAGVVAGFTVPGQSKTVLPREAMAKLDMRLVPNQDPDDIVEKLRAHLDKHGFGDIQINRFSNEAPVRSRSDSLIGKATVAAAERVFDQDPAIAPMMLGTGPMSYIAAELGIPTVSPAGVHRPESNIHAPNENCRVEDFLKIAEYTVEWLGDFATIA
jgi:acetylornithine deacetylase/succinyl-diaminopimelate desuccinylase-like protein